ERAGGLADAPSDEGTPAAEVRTGRDPRGWSGGTVGGSRAGRARLRRDRLRGKGPWREGAELRRPGHRSPAAAGRARLPILSWLLQASAPYDGAHPVRARALGRR